MAVKEVEAEVEEEVEEVIRAQGGRAEEFPDVTRVEGEDILLGVLDVFRIVYKEEGSNEPL